MLLGTFSCGTKPVKFDPDFYRHDYFNEQIVNEDGVAVLCSDPKFNNFASLSQEKIEELISILRRAKIPRSLIPLRDKYVQQLESQLEQMNDLQFN